jgi:hypothetical protein
MKKLNTCRTMSKGCLRLKWRYHISAQNKQPKGLVVTKCALIPQGK